MTDYLDRAENEIARLYADNQRLRAENENERLKEQNYLTVLNANQIEMKRLRAENEQTREINQLRVQATDKLRADNARLRTLLQKTLDEGWVDYGTELSNEIGAELGGKP